MDQDTTKLSMQPAPSDVGRDLPEHVAIICDGNGRWARQRGLPRLEGHRRGVEALRKTIQTASEIGIPYLSIFAFSSENWRRPRQEVSDLMGLLKLFVRRDLADLHRRNVRVKVIGERTSLKNDIRDQLDKTEELTRDNTGMTLLIAFNYGGRQEMLSAVKAIAADVVAGKLEVQDIDLPDIENNLYTAGIPDPDIVIRTSGEQRISNFLTWQTVYSELLFLPVYWPDFDGEALKMALAEYGRRERRFGGL